MVEDKIEEETYSLIFTSLKHPIRRRILRMLADKALTYSEILEILNIDSGHLSYHLENLGDLTVHSSNGQYRLSSFGDAAVKLMGGVEDQKNAKTKRKNSSKPILVKAYSIILALAVIGASLYFVNYSTEGPTQRAVSPINIPQSILYGLANNETVEIIADIQYSDSYPNNVIASRVSFNELSFTINEPQQTLTSWEKATIWIKQEFVPTSSTSHVSENFVTVKIDGRTPSGPQNFTVFLSSPINREVANDFSYLEIEIISPDRLLTQENASIQTDGHDTVGFPSAPITQEGTYIFKLSNPKSWGQSSALSLNIQIHHFEKPYFYLGIAGAIIALGYIILITVTSIKSKNKSGDQKQLLGQ